MALHELAAYVGAAGVVIAAVITSRAGTRKQLQEIHVLVNSRLSDALNQIESLKGEIKGLKKK